MRLFNPYLYYPYHLLVVSILTLITSFIINDKSAVGIRNRRSSYMVFLYAVLFIIVVGLRPVHGAFGDTVNYANTYKYLSLSPSNILTEGDPLFNYLMWRCSQIMDVSWFFLIIECLYVLPIIICCKKLCNNNADIALLICIGAFSFFSYGTNGIRNGCALSFVLLAIPFIQGNIFNKVLCSTLCVLAVLLHATSILPVICLIIALLIKNPKVMFITWVISIIVSIVAGNSVAVLFTRIGFDNRLSDYILATADESMFSHVGFRWDFLLYSMMPILLGWYVIFKKKVYNITYLLLLGTYIYTNSFWILVIRTGYSNRFAYLSWFLYPIVIAYPLLNLRIWPKTQGQKTAIIMTCHLAFTIFMTLVL